MQRETGRVRGWEQSSWVSAPKRQGAPSPSPVQDTLGQGCWECLLSVLSELVGMGVARGTGKPDLAGEWSRGEKLGHPDPRSQTPEGKAAEARAAALEKAQRSAVVSLVPCSVLSKPEP